MGEGFQLFIDPMPVGLVLMYNRAKCTDLLNGDSSFPCVFGMGSPSTDNSFKETLDSTGTSVVWRWYDVNEVSETSEGEWVN
jgi:hypothetical protein